MHVALIGNLSTGYHVAGPFDSYVQALAFVNEHIRVDSLYTIFEVIPPERHMPIDRNHLPGTGDFSPLDEPGPLPEWALQRAQGEVLTNERLFEFVTAHHLDAFYEEYQDEIERLGWQAVEELNDRSE